MLVGALYTDLLTDTLYAVSGTDIVPFIASGARTGRWKSRRFVVAGHPSFAWLRLNGPMSASAVVRIYINGLLAWTSPTIQVRSPVRVPALRGRHWEAEIESTGRVTSMVLASSTLELGS